MLYVSSVIPYAGKSMVALGLALKFREDGYDVVYMKPLCVNPVLGPSGELVDEDVQLLSDVLEVEESFPLLCPVVFSSDLRNRALQGRVEREELIRRVEDAYKSLSREGRIVILGGARELNQGRMLGLSDAENAARLNSKVLLVDRFTDDLHIDSVLAAKEMLGELLIGVVLNCIPEGREAYAKEMVAPFLESRGVPVLGVIPCDPVLASISVGEIAEALEGEVLCEGRGLDTLVENFLVGAMRVESALRYFRRAQNAAVVVGGDRADIQLAAIEAGLKALILTGNLYPSHTVLVKADERGIPVILVKEDTYTTVDRLDEIAGRSRLREPQKRRRAAELIKQHLDFDSLYKALGLS